jgi:hypothetical protein
LKREKVEEKYVYKPYFTGLYAIIVSRKQGEAFEIEKNGRISMTRWVIPA